MKHVPDHSSLSPIGVVSTGTTRRLPLPSNQRGVALVLVLGILVIVSVLAVGFLMLVSTERQSSASYSDNTRTRMLADTTVNLVIGQIRQATDTLNDDPANPKAWASQPGMIRTYGTTGAGGSGLASLSRAYKLYSSDSMVVQTFGTSEANNEVPPADWETKPAIFTDLNQPVQVSDHSNPASTKQRYPIFDPGAIGKVSGVALVNAPGASAKQPAPMPVKWLYVLKDGRYVAAQEISGKPGKVLIDGATEANPIVGRVAFWTDDECAKVNINTASEGVFWDVPYANTVTERAFANSMAVKNEYQRYPGHPATVCMSAVLGGYLSNTTGASTITGKTSSYGLFYDLAPRIATGGSLDGTSATASSVLIEKDKDRLYASVDEYFFREKQTASGRAVNSPELTPDALAQTEFFLTASSRAPEVTLFNTPRVSLWPLFVVQTGAGQTTYRHAYDKLLAFCSSLGEDKSLPANFPAGHSRGYPFYFQRLQTFQQNGGAPYHPTQDYASVPRNQALYAYLQRLTGANIPGFGGNLLAKYPNDRDQILTECFDYIRSQVNTVATPGVNTVTNKLDLSPQYSFCSNYYDVGAIAPIKIGTTLGSGRTCTLQQLALIFFPTEVQEVTKPDGSKDLKTLKMRARFYVQPYAISPGPYSFTPRFNVTISGGNALKADATNLNLPASGNLPFSFNENYYLSDSLASVDKTAMPSPAGQFFYYQSGRGGLLRSAANFAQWESSAHIDVTGKTSFSFNGGPVTVTINSPNGTVVQTLKLKLPAGTFPVPQRVAPFNDAGKTPKAGVPDVYTLNYRDRFLYSIPADRRPGGTQDGQYFDAAGIFMNNTIYPGDTVVGYSVNASDKACGDMRLVALRQSVDDSAAASGTGYFSQLADLNGSGLRVGYTITDPSKRLGLFRKTWTANFKNSEAGGRLVPGLAYPEDAIPFVPQGLNGARNQFGAPGDWDTGFDIQEDGPYIRKADEGSQNRGYFNRGDSIGWAAGVGEIDNRTYSPNRQIASAVMFGSLPTGVNGQTNPEPWQTLLFNPQPAAGIDPDKHYGLKFPQDHLLLDLFWMPIVEPYAISEPFSTAGKINMNYEIMPFRYLKRRTGMEAVLKGVKMTVIPDSEVATYKKQPTGTTPATINASNANYRLAINPDPATGTLKGFENRFSGGDIFRSASEICTISLVPQTTGTTLPAFTTATYDLMASWWGDKRLTGDNLREAPYNQLYPRLTTKSNTFTVYMRVQSLKKNRNSGPANEWDENHDSVSGEYRGSCLIERYIDPNEAELPDFATTSQAADLNGNGTPDSRETLDRYYRFRIVQHRQFAP